jgi:hypothetical protein
MIAVKPEVHPISRLDAEPIPQFFRDNHLTLGSNTRSHTSCITVPKRDG